jgi:AbrB family looped-hinge helix DNA binding protein
MRTVKVTSKRQLTIPVNICKELLIKEGDTLLVDVDGDKIVLTKAPKNFAKHFRGISKGMFGKTADEADAYVAKERKSWE